MRSRQRAGAGKIGAAAAGYHGRDASAGLGRRPQRRRGAGRPGDVCVRYQRFQCTTSSKGRRLGLVIGRSGRVAQTDHVDGEVTVGESQDPPRLLLVDDRRMDSTDAEVGPLPASCSRLPGRSRTSASRGAARPPAPWPPERSSPPTGRCASLPGPRPSPARSAARGLLRPRNSTAASFAMMVLAVPPQGCARGFHGRSAGQPTGARCGAPGWRPTSPRHSPIARPPGPHVAPGHQLQRRPRPTLIARFPARPSVGSARWPTARSASPPVTARRAQHLPAVEGAVEPGRRW